MTPYPSNPPNHACVCKRVCYLTRWISLNGDIKTMEYLTAQYVNNLFFCYFFYCISV